MLRETSSAHVVEDDSQTQDAKRGALSQLAREVVDATEGDTFKGAEMLLQRLRADHPDLYEHYADRAMQQWAQLQIGQARREIRRYRPEACAGKVTISNTPVDGTSLRVVARTWFDWPVLPGIFLGNCTRSNLQQAIDKYEGDAAVYSSRAKWLESIQKLIPDDDAKVRTVLTNDRLAKLANKYGVNL